MSRMPPIIPHACLGSKPTGRFALIAVFPLSGMDENVRASRMFASAFTFGSKHRRGRIILLLAILSAVAPIASACAQGCAFAPQGEGRVAGIVDGRSFRLTDGREIRLAGIESVRPATAAVDGAA